MTPAGAPSSRDRAAFCCLLGIVGAAFVVYGVNMQGVIWYFLMTIVIGTLMQGGAAELPHKNRAAIAAIASFFFTLCCVCLFVLLGAGLSGVRPKDGGGPNIVAVVDRLSTLTHSYLIWLYLGLWAATVLMLVIASLAASYTVWLMISFWNLDDAQVGLVKKKFTAITALASLITGAVAYFKAG